jgi:hypothetical protein
MAPERRLIASLRRARTREGLARFPIIDMTVDDRNNIIGVPPCRSAPEPPHS